MRPETVPVDRALAAALEHNGHDLRRIRRVSVRAYARLEPWALRSASA